VTCVMVVSFMVAAPFSLGSCRRLIRLDRGAELIGRSRVRLAEGA
jgi:LSD1 subclass zinc finger protein